MGILLFLAAGSNLALLVPLLLPFGTARLQRVAGAAGVPGRSGLRTDPRRRLQRLLHCAFGIGAFWAFVIGTVIAGFGYPVAFGVMAASYLAAAALLLLIRERPPPRATA